MPSHNWHNDVFFGIHYDLHARADDTELGAELTAEHLRERLLRVKPDWIQCDCKGHAGYTSWPTEVGTPSPGIVKDALRIHRDVTRELDIKLGMHYSGVWDTRALELHPEWANIDAEGKPSPHYTCRLSAYDDELMIPQMLELVHKYDVDGFWVDGENWASRPCWCDRCRQEFTRRTGLTAIPLTSADANWPQWLAFHRDLFTEHVTSYADAVHARKPDCLICSNWMYTVRQPEPVSAPVDYLSGDYSPSWGADRAAAEGRVMDARGMTWDLMAWGFTRVGEQPWVMKTPTHLCQELSEVIALGGAVMIYDQPQRSGWLTGWHQDVMGEVAAWCRERQQACFGTQTASEAAILHLASHYYTCNDPLFNLGQAHQPVEGALHALLENHLSTDIILEHDAEARLSSYKLIVVPGQTHLSPALQAALTAYATAGGTVLLTGEHLATESPDLVGVAPLPPLHEDKPSLHYLPAGDKAAAVSGPWQPVQPLPGTEVWVELMRQQEPGKDETGVPAVTARRVGQGWVIAAHGPLFRNYIRGHYPLLRSFIGDLIARAQIPWQVTLQAPPRLELITRRRDHQLLINLINRGAAETLSPNRVIVDELLPVTNITVQVRLNASPTQVTITPDTDLTWDYADSLLTIQVPQVDIHSVIAIN